MDHVFGINSKNFVLRDLALDPENVFSKRFIVLHFMFKSIIQNELMFVQSVSLDQGCFFFVCFFSVWISSSSTVC